MRGKEDKMSFHKISCIQCPKHDSCSQKTRVFINYCGSQLQSIDKYIKKAVSECRSKHGFLLQSLIIPKDKEIKTSQKNLSSQPLIIKH
jgi:hypothetical protein